MHTPAVRLGPRRFATFFVLSLVSGMLPGAPVSAGSALLSPPATGPVVRGFEEPAGRYAPGHRGLDIGVPPGTPVRAAADGTVTFAGVIAGNRFVTLRHPGSTNPRGLETTYSFLSRIDVRPGDVVHTGEVVGASGGGHPGEDRPALHFGVRIGGHYVDPAPFLGLAPADVSDLVALGPLPDEDAGPRTATGPPAAGGSTPGPRRGDRHRSNPEAGAWAPSKASGQSGVSGPAGQSPRTTRTSGAGSAIPGSDGETRSAPSGRGLASILAGRLQCSGTGSSPPPALPTASELRSGVRPLAAPNDNVVIAVAGIGSSTWPLGGGSFGSDAAMYQLDLRTLGYPGDRIFHFSYRGAPERSRENPATPYRFHLPYGRDDTFQPIPASAARLEQLVERVHAAHPGRRIDIVAHSQGGIVAQYYLQRLHDPRRPGESEIDHMVTIASPHRGADLAGLAARLGASGTGLSTRRAMDRLAGALGAPPPSSPAARDLAVGSPVMKDLARRWSATTVKTTTIAAGLDLVVPAQRTRLPGAARYTVDLPSGWSSLWAHTAIVGAERTKQIVYGALSDHPAPCTPLQDAMADHLSGPLVSTMAGGLLDLLTAAAAP